jgi:hypothetical protein
MRRAAPEAAGRATPAWLDCDALAMNSGRQKNSRQKKAERKAGDPCRLARQVNEFCG